MSKEPKEYLRHIYDECHFILTVSKDISEENFVKDENLKRAVVRSLEIIGETTKKIPADIKIQWNTIQQKNMAGIRDRLIHDYMGVNYTIVWDVVTNKIPDIAKQISRYLEIK